MTSKPPECTLDQPVLPSACAAKGSFRSRLEKPLPLLWSCEHVIFLRCTCLHICRYTIFVTLLLMYSGTVRSAGDGKRICLFEIHYLYSFKESKYPRSTHMLKIPPLRTRVSPRLTEPCACAYACACLPRLRRNAACAHHQSSFSSSACGDEDAVLQTSASCDLGTAVDFLLAKKSSVLRPRTS